MENLSIRFFDMSPDGLRLVTRPNWAGRCFITSRSRFSAARKTRELARSGIYILVGPYEIEKGQYPSENAKLIRKIYIGKSDVLDERLQQHYDSPDKGFWNTAFAFCRDADLHAGETAELEALLIAKARAAGTHVVTNSVTPRYLEHRQPSGEALTFFKEADSLLRSLGHDFFGYQDEATTTIEAQIHQEQRFTAPDTLANLVTQFSDFCMSLADVEVYDTRTPDLRAKVAHGGSFRVFALIASRKHSLTLSCVDGRTFRLASDSDFNDEVRREIRSAYQRKFDWLLRSGKSEPDAMHHTEIS